MIPAHTEDLTPDGTADFVLVYDASAGGHKKVKLNNLPTAGGGEINTGSNVGTGAGQVFKAKSGVNFEFRNLAAGSSKLTVTNGANDITLDVAQANMDHDALTNFVANEHLDWTADLGATNLHDNNLSTNIPRIASNQEWSKAQGNTESTPASSAGALTLDFDASNYFEVTLTENVTAVTINNTSRPGPRVVRIKRNGTGGWTMAGWPAAVKWPGAVAPTITSAASSKDILSFYVESDGTILETFAQDFR